MNKIEKTIVQLICKYIGRHQNEVEPINDDTFSINIGQRVILNYIGLAYGQVTEVLNKFKQESLIENVEESSISAGDFNVEDSWTITFNPSQITKLYDRSIEGLKLKQEQVSTKRGLQQWSNSLSQKHIEQITDKMIESEFNQGKWLRLCCPACGDFIQEITSFKELKKLEGQAIECRRNHHKCRYRLENGGIDFESIDVDLIQLLKEKKVDK